MATIRSLYLHRGFLPLHLRTPETGAHTEAHWLCRGCVKIARQLGWLTLALRTIDRACIPACRRDGMLPATGPAACNACGAALPEPKED